jgi:hypothetical protein
MIELTVGYVAGIIAFGIVIGKLLPDTKRFLRAAERDSGHHGDANSMASTTLVSNSHHPNCCKSVARL